MICLGTANRMQVLRKYGNPCVGSSQPGIRSWVFKGGVEDRGQNSLQLLLLLKLALILICQKNVAIVSPWIFFIIHTKYSWNVETVIIYHLCSLSDWFRVYWKVIDRAVVFTSTIDILHFFQNWLAHQCFI